MSGSLPSAGPTWSRVFLEAIWTSLGADPRRLEALAVTGAGTLPSVFAVSDLAEAAIAAAGLALAEFTCPEDPAHPVVVDRRLASLWFGMTLEPRGWALPSPWDPIAGDYRTRDGWIRLHTNAPHHRAAALAVLGAAEAKDAVAAAVSGWGGDDLEAAVVARGGCAAVMRSLGDWRAHPQGRAVAGEPLLRQEVTRPGPRVPPSQDPARPLRGLRVLDLTRVLAGPVATRLLAGFGAQVLRIDPPGWDEPGVVPEVTLGKACARLDLRIPAGRDRLLALLAQADVLVHGYRPGALDGLGLPATLRDEVRPGLVEVTLDAYGWQGPWAGRRGFDSLVQMSSGLAAEGMSRTGAERPRPLPVQALDHATGYIMAACALRGLALQRETGLGSRWLTSLAGTAHLLARSAADLAGEALQAGDTDWQDCLETTAWGPARRLRPPLAVGGAAMAWDRPAEPLGQSPVMFS